MYQEFVPFYHYILQEQTPDACDNRNEPEMHNASKRNYTQKGTEHMI